MKTVLVSGGFDPLHIGHVALLREAALYGEVIVALNSDEWLRRKKGHVVMPWADRATILLAIRHVTNVTPVTDSDGTVCEALRRIRPTAFANGGDRTTADPREHAVCADLDIMELFGIGGAKARSSSEIVRSACQKEMSSL